MVKLNVGKNRRKLPWYEYLSSLAGSFVAILLVGMLGDLGILIAIAGALVGGFVVLRLAYELGKWLGERLPALRSEHVGYFDR